jgi:hypothetical protein
MSDITISVIQPPSTTINVGVDETTLIQAGIGLPPHSVTHISGGSDEVNHNLLGGLQGGSGGQYYHLSSGQYFNLITGTGSFYPNSNPSGFITGVDLTPYATVTYVTGVSGILQNQIANLNNATGDYALKIETGNFITTSQTGQFYSSNNPSGYVSTGYVTGVSGNLQQQITTLNNQTGSFYPRTNPSGYITGINNIVFTTGNQIISGAKTFTGSFNVSTNDAIVIRSTGYTNGVEIGGGFFNRIADGGFINDFGVNGTENHFGDSATSSNSFGGSASQNDFGAYATLNNYYAGFGIGQFDFDTRPTVSGTGVLLEGEIPDTGYLSGYVNKNETGDFYSRSNPSGFITGISNLVFTTGDQTISGAKTFSNNLIVGGNDLFVDTSNDRVGIFTASPTATLDINGSGIFRSGLNTNLITSISSSLDILGKNNATQAFPGNFIGASVNLNAGSGNFIPGFISLKAGAHPTSPGAISLNGGLNASNIPEGRISLNSKSIEVNNNNSYASSTIFYKTGFPFASENINISQNSISIFNNLLITGNRPTVNGTGILLSGEATTQDYVTGISGELQTQITNLNNATGSYVLNSQTGVFYPRTNPSGYITGVDLSFSGNYYTKDESESRYVNTTGAETILGDKTFHDKVYINNLYVTGLETIINTTNTNVASNYLLLNLTGGAVDGGIFFITGSGLSGINDSGAIIGFDHSDKFKFGIATRASDLSTLDTIASYEEVTGISGSLQTQISTLNSATGNYALKIETGNFITNSQTGEFYANSNPSGFITGISDIVFATGNQSISGIKTFNNNLIVGGNDLFVDVSNDKVGILTATPTATLDVNGSGLFRSGLNVNGTLYTSKISNFDDVFAGNSVNIEAGSGNFIGGSIDINGGKCPTNPGIISLRGGLNNQNIPQGTIELKSKSILFNQYATYSTDVIFYKSGFLQENLRISENEILIKNNLLISGTRPTVNSTGILLSGEAVAESYVTGISGNLQSQITNLNNATGSYILNSQTGDFYASSNPSGFITGIENIVFITGDQTISGIKTFSTGVNVTGDVNINGNLTISGQYNVYQQIENAKILAIAYAIAL